MKKGIAVCIMVFLGLMWSTTAFSNEYDFRKTNWGMSMEEVAEAEDALELQYGETITISETNLPVLSMSSVMSLL